MSVRIPQDSERSNLVRIEGDPKGVQLARRELIEMVQRMVRGVSAPLFALKVEPLKVLHPGYQENERTKDLIVDQKFHRTIIGQKGEKIKEVRDKFPEVFPDSSSSSPVTLFSVFSALTECSPLPGHYQFSRPSTEERRGSATRTQE